MDAHIVSTMHDEMIVESKTKNADYCKEIIEECLTEVFKDIMPEMPFETKAWVGDSWGD